MTMYITASEPIQKRHPHSCLTPLVPCSSHFRQPHSVKRHLWQYGLQDLVKDSGHVYFVGYLNLQEERTNRSSAQAAFVLAVVCDSHPRGQALCAQANLLQTLLRLLSAPGNTPLQGQTDFAARDTGLLVKWACLGLGKLCRNLAEVSPSSCLKMKS